MQGCDCALFSVGSLEAQEEDIDLEAELMAILETDKGKC